MDPYDPTFDLEYEYPHRLRDEHPDVVADRMRDAYHRIPDSRGLRDLCERVRGQYEGRYRRFQHAKPGSMMPDPYDEMKVWLDELERFVDVLSQPRALGLETRLIDRALAGAQSLNYLSWLRLTETKAAEREAKQIQDGVRADMGHALRWVESTGAHWDNRPDKQRDTAAPILYLPSMDSGPRTQATEDMEQIAPLVQALGFEKSDVLYHQYDMNLAERIVMCGRFIWSHKMVNDEAKNIFKHYIAPRLVDTTVQPHRLKTLEELPPVLLRIVGHSMGCILTRLVQNATIDALTGPHPETYGLPPRAASTTPKAARAYAQGVTARIPALSLGMQMAMDVEPAAATVLPEDKIGFPTLNVFSAVDSLMLRMPLQLSFEQNRLLDARRQGLRPGLHEHGQRRNLYLYLPKVPVTYKQGEHWAHNDNGHHLGGYLSAMGLDAAGLADPGPDARLVLDLLQGAPYAQLRETLSPECVDVERLKEHLDNTYPMPFAMALSFLLPVIEHPKKGAAQLEAEIPVGVMSLEKSTKPQNQSRSLR